MKFRMLLISPPAVEPLEEPEPEVPLEVAPLPPLLVAPELVPFVVPLLVVPLPLEPWPNRLSSVHAAPPEPLGSELLEPEPLDVDPLEPPEAPLLSHPLPEPLPPCFATP